MTSSTRTRPLGGNGLPALVVLLFAAVAVPGWWLLQRDRAAPRARPTRVVSRAYFTRADAPRARALYLARAAEQVDRRTLEAPPGRDAVLASLLGAEASALSVAFETELTRRAEGGPETRSRVVSVLPGALRSVAWSEDGRLVVTAWSDGEVSGALAGVTRAGLDATAAERVAETVRGLFTGQVTGVATVAQEGATALSALVPGRRLEASSELLARGLVRLDLRDGATLARQPALVRAALLGLEATEPSAAALVGEARYRAAVLALSGDTDDAGARDR